MESYHNVTWNFSEISTDSSLILVYKCMMEYASQEKHLGNVCTTKSNASAIISARIHIGKQNTFMIMGAGFHGYNGVNPEVSIHIINAFILLTIMFGLETLKLTPSDYREISGFHRKLLS